jgi:hypothetical protein
LTALRPTFADLSSERRVPRYGKALHHLLGSSSATASADVAAGLTAPTGDTSGSSQPLFVRPTAQAPRPGLDGAVPVDAPAGTAVFIGVDMATRPDMNAITLIVSDRTMILLKALATHDGMELGDAVLHACCQHARRILGPLARAVLDEQERALQQRSGGP